MKRNIFLAYIYSIFYNSFLDLALWPIYLTRAKGFSIVELGVFQAIFAVTRLALDVPAGVVCDKIGRVKTLFLTSFAMISSSIFMIIGHSMFVVSIAYILFGVSTALLSGSLEAFVYDSVKESNLEERYKAINTNIYVALMISMSVSMLLGGFLSMIDMKLMYVGNIILAIIALISTFFMEEPPVYNKSSVTTIGVVVEALTTIKIKKNLFYLIVFISITSAISNGTWHLSQKLFSDTGLSDMKITFEAILTTLACGIGARIGYYADKRFGKMGNSIFTVTALIFPLILLGLTKNIYLMFTALTFTTVSLSFATPIYSGYINSEVSSNFRSTFLSIENFIIGACYFGFVSILSFTSSIAKSFVMIGLLAIPIYAFILVKIRSFEKRPYNNNY